MSSDVFEQVGGNRNKDNCTDFKCTLQLDWTEFINVNASFFINFFSQSTEVYVIVFIN